MPDDNRFIRPDFRYGGLAGRPVAPLDQRG
jgi:hypothetical protein